ncbi:glucose-inhibited division protein B [Nautilia sp. PV-1]|jgi:uncharacterized protein|uniref:LIM domain-containing protein n=1 Tax=Nautilia sp. PV-1 TaxID=2579250 RepID=UPI000FDBF03B|nr:LIM domain-containing protein [Nautilia sp. PV-1]AZV46241.1 glucose-inhibited division protein B [Nautilia sp. PV-1]
MGKLILLLLIGFGFYYFFIKPKDEPKNNKNSEEENEFIQCQKCGTFVLKKEMKEKNGKLLCKDCYADS